MAKRGWCPHETVLRIHWTECVLCREEVALEPLKAAQPVQGAETARKCPLCGGRALRLVCCSPFCSYEIQAAPQPDLSAVIGRIVAAVCERARWSTKGAHAAWLRQELAKEMRRG
jgi:hypothetical protein